MTQEEALDILKLGYNMFLTGPPGSGKTFLLNSYINYLKRHCRGVAVTASTGIAATHLNGVTVHSWSGLGIKEKLTNEDIRKLLKKSYLRKRFKQTNILVIDEISMLHAFQFDLLNRICQVFKADLAPFGGMQVVCSGDLFQLPPVGPVRRVGRNFNSSPNHLFREFSSPPLWTRPSNGVEKERGAEFVVASKVWPDMDIKICYLEEQYRHQDNALLTLLNHIRNNAIEESRKVLANREYEEGPFPIVPTKLYTHNIDVDAINNLELGKIKEKEFVYQMEARGNKGIVASLIKSCLTPEKLVLKKGAQIMFVKNNFERGYVNGTRGRVIGFAENDLPIVETLSGKRVVVGPASWTVEEDDIVKAKISQIPLRLAWAITVHKSQGMNLDAAEIDLSKCFVEGMGYVALSRLRSLTGLKLVGINELALWVNEDVLHLDKELRRMSQEVAEDFRKMPLEEKKRKQRQFLHSLPQVRRSKKGSEEKEEAVSTYEQTRALVLEKLPLKEIARRRGLTEDTILGHLEKLVERGADVGLEYLRLPQERFEKIRTAFRQAGTWQLTPVREILGENFSYRELRLVRLLIRKRLREMRKNQEAKKLTQGKSEILIQEVDVVRPKNYRCQNCGRPINHQGNCLPCNAMAKYKREGKEVPQYWLKFYNSQ